MKLNGLDHITINTEDLQASLEFYSAFLDLKPGPRPGFDVEGVWLYASDGRAPIVHLICQAPTSPGSGGLDHVAFSASGLQDYFEKLTAAKQDYMARPVHDLDMTQVFQRDPSGVLIEVNFYGEPIPAGMALSKQA